MLCMYFITILGSICSGLTTPLPRVWLSTPVTSHKPILQTAPSKCMAFTSRYKAMRHNSHGHGAALCLVIVRVSLTST
ncbi:hypothetical protein J3F83DRAFT_727519 [Trichoderma novae-zelandiae]